MSVVMLFEDNKDSASSCLLKSAYNGKNVEFSCGYNRLLKKLKELYNSNDIFFVFVDVAPNNPFTVEFYKSFLDYDFVRSHDNIYTVPIVCIEYYLFWSVYNLGYIRCNSRSTTLALEHLILHPSFSELSSCFKKRSESIEQMYKIFFDKKPGYNNVKCMINGIPSEDFGLFYRIDCDNCSIKDCPLGCSDTLVLKAERLYTSLPVFAVVDTTHEKLLRDLSLSFKSISPQELLDNVKNFYNNMCKLFGFQPVIVRLNMSGKFTVWE